MVLVRLRVMVMQVRATTAIRKGEEITTRYGGLNLGQVRSRVGILVLVLVLTSFNSYCKCGKPCSFNVAFSGPLLTCLLYQMKPAWAVTFNHCKNKYQVLVYVTHCHCHCH